MNEDANQKETQSVTEAGETTTPVVTVTKMMVDKPSDFRFHAAYLSYSDAWDKTSLPESKSKLNEILTALQSEKIDYETFYRELSQYRGGGDESFRGRAFIETQRKKDWRKRDERERRNKRHGR
jgi:uncharacterized protein YdiU (UPF0061 family)